MVAFETGLDLALDAMTFDPDEGLWFAARTQSKPGLWTRGKRECWTLISTPAFAVREITSTPMQDKETGTFKPQKDSYLNGDGGPARTNSN